MNLLREHELFPLDTPGELAAFDGKIAQNMSWLVDQWRALVPELLEHVVDMPTIDGRPVFVRLRHTSPEAPTQESTDPSKVFEHFQKYHNTSEKLHGHLRIGVDLPIQAHLPSQPSRLRIALRTSSNDSNSYAHDMTAHRTVDADTHLSHPVLPTDVRNQFSVRNYDAKGKIRLRAAVQSSADEFHGLYSLAFSDEPDNLHAAYERADVTRSRWTNAEKQIANLGARTLVYSQLATNLAALNSIVYSNTTEEMSLVLRGNDKPVGAVA